MQKAELIALACQPGYDREQEEARAALRRFPCPAYGGDPIRPLRQLAALARRRKQARETRKALRAERAAARQRRGPDVVHRHTTKSKG